MPQLVDAVCLVHVNTDKVARELYYYQPSSFPLEVEIQYLILNCLPEDFSGKDPFCYCFSLLNYMGYSLFFSYNEKFYVLVLLSKYLFPSIFFEFLSEANKLVKEKEHLDPFVDEIWMDLQTWVLTNEEKTNLQFPYDVRQKKLNDDAHVFNEFDPWSIFPNHPKFFSICHSLLIGAPVKVFASNEQMLTKAVFAVLSLIEPYKYASNVLILLNAHDPRMAHSSDYPVVGVLRRHSQLALGSFTNVITQSSVIDEDYEHFRTEHRGKMEKFNKIHNYLMNRVLILNPYNDLLEGSFVDDHLGYEMKKNDCDDNGVLTVNDLRLFEKSKTAIEYRRKEMYRDAFRNAFLSISAEEALKGQSYEQLIAIKTILDKMKIDFSGDAHIKSVLKAHSKELHHLLLEIESRDKEVN